MATPLERSVVVIGAGVVGAALAARLREENGVRSLRVTARTPEGVGRLRAQGFDAHPLDIVNATMDSLAAWIGDRAQVVYSAAAGRGGDYRAVYEEGTAKLAAACRARAARLVYTSSTGVYAARAGEWVDEDAELAEDDLRTSALVAAERNVLEVAGTVLRLSGILAPERGPHRRLDSLAGTARDDGEAWVNLAPLPTIVDALAAVLERDWRGVANVSAAHPLRRRDFYDALLARASLAPITWTPGAPGADLGRRVRVDRLRSELGVEPLEVDTEWLLS